MPRYLLVKPAKGISVPHPHAERRFVGKPNVSSPLWASDEEPQEEVVLDAPALRKAARGANLTILGEKIVDGDISAARAALQPPQAPVKSGKDK